MKFDGDHNSPRPSFFYDSVVIFFYNTLQVELLLTEETKIKNSKSRKSSQLMEDDGEFNLYESDPNFLLSSLMMTHKSAMGEAPIR